MSRDDDRRELGISHRFEGFVDTVLDVEVPMQVRHARKRGGWGSRCGTPGGQAVDIPSAVTCPACLKKTRGRR